MKSRFTLASLLFFFVLAAGMKAQIASATVFSEDGDRFYLIVNGIRQNAEPATNVKISDLAANEGARYRMKIIFEDDAKGEIDKNLYPQAGMDMVMAIRYKAKKDEYVLRMSALNELPFEPEPIVYHTEPLPVHSSQTHVNSNMGINTNVTVTETQTTTTTVGQPLGESESISVNMNVGGINMGGSVTVNESYSSSSTTTTTTTTTTGGSMGGMW